MLGAKGSEVLDLTVFVGIYCIGLGDPLFGIGIAHQMLDSVGPYAPFGEFSISSTAKGAAGHSHFTRSLF